MSDMITLYHGTTASAAEQILREGFVAMDHAEVLRSVAERHEVPVEALEENLQMHGSFLAVEHGRGSRVSFTPIRANVESTWAQNAPEARREALWAVWRTKYSTLPDPYAWATDVEGHAFVIEALDADDPVVLELEVERSTLLALDAQVASFRASPLTEAHLVHIERMPEIAFPLPFTPPSPLTVHPIERRIGWDVFAHWLGMDISEFRKRDDAGEFGPAGIGRFDVQPWWPLEQVDAVLERFGCR